MNNAEVAETLLPCPFCGEMPATVGVFDNPRQRCNTDDCAMFGMAFTRKSWNTRAPALLGKKKQ